MEGLYEPLQFPFPKAIDKHNVLKAIVKVRPLRMLEYSFFQNDDEADQFSKTLIDENGFETIRCGMTEADKEKCKDPEFSQALFTHEFCELMKTDKVLPQKARLLGHGTGIAISPDGYIATNFHLISGAAEFLEKLDGHFGSKNLLIKNIEIDFAYEISDLEIKYKKASEVFLAATYSMADAYGKKLDLAILKINESTPHFLPMAKDPANRFERIFSIGFSMRTSRQEEKKIALGYQDAAYDLRVSSGLITQFDSENSFLADTDGAPGNSGSAAINSQGELVGIYCGSTGNGIVNPSKSLRRYVGSQHLSELLKGKIRT